MKLLLSSFVLSLAWFAAVDIVLAAVAWLAARRTLAHRQAGTGWLLILRLFPASVAAIVAVFIFLPGHLLFEPAESGESFGVVLIALGCLAAILIGRSAARLLVVVRASIRMRQWHGRTLRSPHAPPVKVVEVGEVTGVSLAGIFGTRILVGSRARAALTAAEIDVAVAHELAHRRSGDNVKRCLMFCVPDVFGVSRTAKAVEHAWRAEAECRADAIAAAGDAHRAMLLASALLKVARLDCAPRPQSPVWSTFHDAPLIETRVRRLASAMDDTANVRRDLRAVPIALVGLALGLWLTGAVSRFHALTELLVASLP